MYKIVYSRPGGMQPLLSDKGKVAGTIRQFKTREEAEKVIQKRSLLKGLVIPIEVPHA